METAEQSHLVTETGTESGTIKIVHAPTELEPFVVVSKPSGLPSAPLAAGGRSAFTQAQKLYPQLALVHGKKEVEHGLLHRLDTDTSGLLLIAATDEAYGFLCRAQEEGTFTKTYMARCQIEPSCTQKLGGFPPIRANAAIETVSTCMHGYIVSSFFRPYGTGRKSVRPVTESSGPAAIKKSGSKLYTTHISTEQLDSRAVTATCRISAGYRHQVRCHLAWLNLPILGDRLYNPLFTEGEKLCFTATAIQFPNPATGKLMEFSICG